MKYKTTEECFWDWWNLNTANQDGILESIGFKRTSVNRWKREKGSFPKNKDCVRIVRIRSALIRAGYNQFSEYKGNELAEKTLNQIVNGDLTKEKLIEEGIFNKGPYIDEFLSGSPRGYIRRKKRIEELKNLLNKSERNSNLSRADGYSEDTADFSFEDFKGESDKESQALQHCNSSHFSDRAEVVSISLMNLLLQVKGLAEFLVKEGSPKDRSEFRRNFGDIDFFKLMNVLNSLSSEATRKGFGFE